MCKEDKIYRYSEKDFIFTSSWQDRDNNLSKFDEALNTAWKTAMDKGFFRFKLNINKTKKLKGRFGFIAQLNLERKLKRRQPQDIQSMGDPFNPNNFNFTQIPDREILFKLKREEGGENMGEDIIAINVSPLSVTHCLIVPQVDMQLPQILTVYAARLAVETLLLSSDLSLRIGFNSLCAFASVNHLHLHIFLLPLKMILETIPLKPFSGPCYEITDYAFPGFAFEEKLKCSDDVINLARNTHKLTTFLQERKIAHNVNWTRSGDRAEDSARPKVRVYVWVRQNNVGAKSTDPLNPALCEFFGLLDYKVEDEYETATEESVCQLLQGQMRTTFPQLRAAICDLFSGNTNYEKGH